VPRQYRHVNYGQAPAENIPSQLLAAGGAQRHPDFPHADKLGINPRAINDFQGAGLEAAW